MKVGKIFKLLLTIAVTLNAVSAECLKTDTECVFYLKIEHMLTMMKHKDLVYPYNGNLYKYDVYNTTDAETIPADDVITADGWGESRLVAVANGTMPGPDIIVYEGQTVTVHVKNTLRSHAITIHWHGLHQSETPWMDGVPWVTQCPIQPGQSFTYSFKAKPRGTFWWHSHVGAQRSMGLFGAFIIKENTNTDVEEHIMQITDWNHDWDSDTGHMKMLYGVYEGREKWGGAKSLDGSFFSMFRVQSGLINGRGRYHDPKTGSNFAPLTVYSVTQGKKYRFRVIGPGALYPFRVSVDNHILTVIASDGYDLQPVIAESFVINPGERFDFEITANQSVGNYWVRGITLEQGEYHEAEAILRYSGATKEDPQTSRQECTDQIPCLVLNCPFTYYPANFTSCRRLDQLKALATDDPAPAYSQGKFQEYFLNFAFPGIKSYPGSVNGRTFDTPDVNPLTQPKEWHSPCDDSKCGEGKHCKCTFALNIGRGDTIQMVFMNMGRGKGWSHPIHMHGHSFYVVKMGYGKYDPDTGAIEQDNSDVDCRGIFPDKKDTFCNDATWSNSSWLNGNVPGLELDRPPRKDTIIVPTGGYVVIRIRADNPGLWNMHCHIELHNLDGMQMLLNESFSEIPSPPEDFPECHSYPPKASRRQQQQQKNDETDNEKTEKTIAYTTFWLMFSILLGVVIIEFFVIVSIIACTRRRIKSSSKYSAGQGQRNIGYNATN